MSIKHIKIHGTWFYRIIKPRYCVCCTYSFVQKFKKNCLSDDSEEVHENPRRLIKISEKERPASGRWKSAIAREKEDISLLAELLLKVRTLSEVHSRLNVTKGP